MTLRCSPTLWLALSLKCRQKPHCLCALLLFTFLKRYDIKIVMLPWVIIKLYFFSTLDCLPSTYLLIHQQKKRFRLLSIITSPEATTHDTEHTISTRHFLFYISICCMYICRCKNTPILDTIYCSIIICWSHLKK